jgi:excisionase family DNA binding protein
MTDEVTELDLVAVREVVQDLVAALDPRVRPTISVEEVAVAYGIGRQSAYQAVRAGEIPSIRIGGKIRIPTAMVRRDLGLDPVGG